MKKQSNVDYYTATVFLLGTTGHHLHHMAMRRGYQKKDDFSVAEYNGRFGKGFTIDIPTNLCRNYRHNNTYHMVEYWTKKQ